MTNISKINSENKYAPKSYFCIDGQNTKSEDAVTALVEKRCRQKRKLIIIRNEKPNF